MAEARTVLVVDDEEDVRELVAYRLRKAKFNVITATNGQEAVDLAIEEHPDLIVMDVMMPRMNGYLATETLRANETTRDIPVILLTARVQDEDVSRGFEVGADDYVRKPFNPTELQMRVQSMLGRQ